MINRFILNEVSYFGPGAREVLPKEITRLGLHKAFVATDKDLIKYGVADKVLSVLKAAGIPYEVFSEIKQNPTVFNVKSGVKAFAESGADFILAIGGGSSIDTAKAIGIITNNPEFSDVVSLEGVVDTKKKSVPIIALPTTAGTAAEVTINYVITDEVNEKKMVCVDPNDIPAIAVVDAELMYTLPKSLTASTGLDALTHAIEGLITKGAWEMSDMFEIKAIEMIARYLETAVNEPTNAEAMVWLWHSILPEWHSLMSVWEWCTEWLIRWELSLIFLTGWLMLCCCLLSWSSMHLLHSINTWILPKP